MLWNVERCSFSYPVSPEQSQPCLADKEQACSTLANQNVTQSVSWNPNPSSAGPRRGQRSRSGHCWNPSSWLLCLGLADSNNTWWKAEGKLAGFWLASRLVCFLPSPLPPPQDFIMAVLKKIQICLKPGRQLPPRLCSNVCQVCSVI